MRRSRQVLALAAISATAVVIASSGATGSDRSEGSANPHATLSGAVATAYDYDLAWSPAQRLLRGTGVVTARNLGPAPISHVWLYLRANGDGRLARVGDVDGAVVGSERADGAMQRLDLSAPLAPGDAVVLRFRYALRVPLDDTSLGRSGGVDLFGDALPVVAAAGRGGVRIGAEPEWGEGTLNPVADWRVHVRVPRGLDVALPGQVERRRTGSFEHYSTAIDVRDVSFAVGRLSSRSASVLGVRVRVVAADPMRSQLGAALRRAVHSFRTMQHLYGGYELKQLNVVVVPLSFGGSEYPGIVFSSPDLATIAHEVAHQWFYGIVGNDQFREPWLDESITSFHEQKFSDFYECDLDDPLDGARRGLGNTMAYWDRHPDSYQDTIYRGGACALMRLEHDIGRRAMHRVLRRYIRENRQGIASTEAFVSALYAEAPRRKAEAWLRLVGLA